VTWNNEANGQSGFASVDINCWVVVLVHWRIPFGWIHLEFGENLITVTASDSLGNRGSERIKVYRHPDVTPPSVISTTPADGSTDLPINTSVIAVFSEEMASSTINTSSYIVADSGNNLIDGTVHYDSYSKTAILTPSNVLDYSTVYTATLTHQVKDLAGGNALAAAYSWSFTTGTNPDSTPPAVTATTPVDGSNCTPVNGSITATFTEDIDPLTIDTTTFVVSDGSGNPISGAVTYSNMKATFTPDVSFASGSAYTATITTGVKDLAGNAMLNDYTWSFDTTSAGYGAWESTSINEAPLARSYHTAVWTDSEMIISGGFAFDPVWGTFNYTNTGGRYDPVADTWQPTSTSGAPARFEHTAIWTGSEMIVWGGKAYGTPSGSGAAYNPDFDTWRAISNTGAPSSRHAHTAIWTGSEMIVWGGKDSTGVPINTGGRYDPSTDTWQPVSTIGAPSGRYYHTAVWTGSEMIIWGGFDNSHLFNTGGRYDPVADTWQPVSTIGAPSGRHGHTAVWTGSEMIIWGEEYGYSNTGGRYSPATDSWQPTETICAPTGRVEHTVVWTGNEMIVWGGSDGKTFYFGDGATYDPTTDTWEPIATTTAPSPRDNHTAVWTGSEMIVWGGRTGGVFMSGGRYRP